MASNNDDSWKKQKKTAVDSDVIIDGDSSSTPTIATVIPSLSLGDILQQFPDLLMQLLPYIADRTIFNAIASCNRDINEKSKAIVPPWPNHYRLPASNGDSIAVWSPNGTRVAYTGGKQSDIIADVIIIIDQRHGIIHRIINNSALVSDLKFSPDGRILVSAGRDDTVKLWDNVAETYEQLQGWNVREGIGEIRFDISACSKYIVVAAYSTNRVVLISVENGEIIRSFTPRQPVSNRKRIGEVMFSVDCRAVFICCLEFTDVVIKLWQPYLNNTDEDSLTTLWEQKFCNPKIIVSHDKTMIAIQDMSGFTKGWLLSIHNNYSCTVQKLNYQGSDLRVLVQFTPDDECIIYVTEKGLKYWSVAERKFTDNNKYLVCTMNCLRGANCSPNHRQLIVHGNNKVEIF